MMAVFFFGIGGALFLTGFATSPWQIAVGLTLTGMFAAIYHPVGIAMLVASPKNLGMALGWNGLWGNLGLAFAAHRLRRADGPVGLARRVLHSGRCCRSPPASRSCCWCPIRARCRRSRRPSACTSTAPP